MCAGNLENKKRKVYQIKLLGKLDGSWSDWFSGMSLTSETRDDGTPVTILTGTVLDQAALYGLLDRISDLNLTLISVTLIE